MARTTLGTAALAALLLGFRCPGADPTLVFGPPGSGGSGGVATTVSATGGGGAPPGCPPAELPRVTRQPHDIVRNAQGAEEVTMEFALDPEATSHRVVVVDVDDGTVLLENTIVDGDESFITVSVTLPSTGRYQARLRAEGVDCATVVETRVFAGCESMWVDTSLPDAVIDFPAVVAGDRVVTPSIGSTTGLLLSAGVASDGALQPWLPANFVAGGGTISVATGGTAAVAVPTDDGAPRIYYLGGRDGQLQPVAAVRTIESNSLLSPPVNVSSTDPLPAPVADGAAAYLDGTILYVGGTVSGSPSAIVWAAATSGDGSLAGSWFPLGDTPKACAGCAAVAFDGNLYTVGGFDGQVHATVARAFFADATTLEWPEGNVPLPFPRANVALAVDPDRRRLFAVGGVGANSEPASLVFEGLLDADGQVISWGVVEPLPRNTTNHSAVWTDGYLHAIGGNAASDKVTSMAFKGPEGTPLCPISL